MYQRGAGTLYDCRYCGRTEYFNAAATTRHKSNDANDQNRVIKGSP